MHLRIISFNIAHGRGLMPHQGLTPPALIRRNLDRIADLLIRLRPDVVCLQEIDTDSVWNGAFDHLEYLRARCGYPFSAFGANATLGGALRLVYGNAVLSRHAILHSDSVRFDRQAVGGKGALYCEVVAGNRVVPVVNVHLHHRWKARRRRQAGDIVRFIEGKQLHATHGPRTPPLILGDFNAPAHSHGDASYYLSTEGFPLELYGIYPVRARTFPSLRPTRMIDFVMVPKSLRVAHSGVVRSRLSDHLPVLVDVEVG